MEIHHEPLSDVERYIEKYHDFSLEDREDKYRGLLKTIRRFTPVDETAEMLEIGTGIGWFPVMCARDGLRCRGIEISPFLVECGRMLGLRSGVEVDIQLGNVEETDLGDSIYDVIIAQSLFEHVQHWQRGVRNVFRALKPGGVLYFQSTNKFSLVSGEYRFPFYGWLPDAWRYRLRVMRQGDDIMKHGIDFNQFTYYGLRRFFTETGFSRVLDVYDVFDPDDLHHPMIWKRIALKALGPVPPLRALSLAFAGVTIFVCVK